MNKIKKIIELSRLPEMSILPGHLTFFLILSLFPLFSLIGVVITILPIETSSIVEFLSHLPSSVSDILVPFLTDSANTINIIFIILILYLSSNSSSAIILASNTVYKIKNKHYIHRKIKSVFMTFWLLLSIIFAVVILAFGTFILESLANIGLIDILDKSNIYLINIYKYIIGFIFIFLTIKIIYTMAPDSPIKSKYVNVGALFATVGIIVVTAGYSFYLTNIANYDLLYGNLANIVSLMLMMYLISYTLILGIMINSNYYEK